MRIAGPDPYLSFPTRLDATTHGFLAFDVTGQWRERDVLGAVYFSVADQPGSEAQQVVFRWRADGRPRPVRVALLAHPAWRGTITGIRIDPVNVSLVDRGGETVRVDNVRAGGTFTRVLR